MSDAVPSRTSLPPEVTGLLVPARCAAKAVVKLPRVEPVIGRFVPGLRKPDMGLPAFDMGRTLCEIPPGWPELVKGLENEVPGLGACVIAFSSKLFIAQALTHKHVTHAFLLDLKIINIAFLS